MCVFFDISKTVYGRNLVHFQPETKETKMKNTLKTKLPKLSKIVIFTAKNEHEFRLVCKVHVCVSPLPTTISEISYCSKLINSFVRYVVINC